MTMDLLLSASYAGQSVFLAVGIADHSCHMCTLVILGSHSKNGPRSASISRINYILLAKSLS